MIDLSRSGGNHLSTPISAAQNRSTFLGLLEKLTGTGRPQGDSAEGEVGTGSRKILPLPLEPLPC
jgi:hypothetical protein